MRRLASFVLMILISAPLLAQNTSALINEALDKIYPLDLSKTTLPIAMKVIGEQTGVRVEASPEVWELLPWGDQTTLAATIKNTTLREGLNAIARKLGLTVVLKDETVELRPMPALSRLGRRSTVQELEALSVLASNPVSLNTDRPTIRQLLEAVDQKLVDLKSPYAIENRASDVARPDQQVFVARNATLMDALESIAKDSRATWYPWGKSIVVVSKEDQIRNLLGKSINLRYNGVDVGQVLAELSQRSGIDFSIEPGAIQRIPAASRNVRLILDNATVKQALESVAGFTGLGYVVNENGVYIWNTMASSSEGARDPTIALLQLDNGVQVLIPQSQVPPDMQEFLRTRIQQELSRIRSMMKEQGFKPATRPTSRPDL